VVLVETFTDPALHAGTCYRATNFEMSGETSGWRRSRGSFVHHGQVKSVWHASVSSSRCRLVAPVIMTGTVHRLLELADRAPTTGTGRAFGPGGESEAHRLLKLYVAARPVTFGLSSQASAHVEYPFATGDRVDVLFENHLPERTVVEVEVAGEQNVCVGIHQAIKYRTLAAVDAGHPLLTSKVRSLVVAYTTEYERAAALAERYEIELQSVDRELVLATAE
jgi:hypothetical protein